MLRRLYSLPIFTTPRAVVPHAILILLALTVTPAQAALELERNTSLRDAYGGEYTAVTTGQLDQPGRSTHTEARFTHFHPDGEDNVVNGLIQRQQTRQKNESISLLNGELTVSTEAQGGAESLHLVFTDLRFFHEGDGREASGQLSVNGEVIDASEMPRRVARTLRRVLHFLR